MIHASTGKLEWRSVNNAENVQIGHHHLWLNELDRAAEIYNEAKVKMSKNAGNCWFSSGCC